MVIPKSLLSCWQQCNAISSSWKSNLRCSIDVCSRFSPGPSELEQFSDNVSCTGDHARYAPYFSARQEDSMSETIDLAIFTDYV